MKQKITALILSVMLALFLISGGFSAWTDRLQIGFSMKTAEKFKPAQTETPEPAPKKANIAPVETSVAPYESTSAPEESAATPEESNGADEGQTPGIDTEPVDDASNNGINTDLE